MSVETKHEIGALTGVDLDDQGWLRKARATRARAAYEPRVAEEIERLTRRVAWLSRKAARLAKGSNGRRKLDAEARECQVLAAMLAQALSGRPVQKLQAGAKHPAIARAVALLNELAEIR